VVFDFDGVLVDSNAVKRQAYFDIFADLGARVTAVVERVLREDVDGDRFDTIRRVLRHLDVTGPSGGGTATTPERLVQRYADCYNEICEDYAATCAEVPGASEALVELGSRYPLYVVSATPQSPLRRIVERRGWSSRFRDVLGRPGSKREHLESIAEREGIRGDGVVMIGDGLRDLLAARAVGCHFVGVRNPFNDFDDAGLTMIADLHALPNAIEAAAC
jgi:phosphoglycolate phosphatase-like HAD superfamily hydrolase